MRLKHLYDKECTGYWKRVGASVECNECHNVYPVNANTLLSALDENYAGIYLLRLTREGAGMI